MAISPIVNVPTTPEPFLGFALNQTRRSSAANIAVIPESRALLVRGVKHHGAAITGTQRTSDPQRIATVRIDLLRPPLIVTGCGSLRVVEISVERSSNGAKQNAMAIAHADEAILDVHYPVVGQHGQALS